MIVINLGPANIRYLTLGLEAKWEEELSAVVIITFNFLVTKIR